MGARLLWTLAAAALLASGTSAHAAEGDLAPTSAPILVAFTYQAPVECMSETQAFSLVHRRSRRLVRGSEQEAQQKLSMQIAASGEGYQGVLVVERSGEEERRRMFGDDCEEVVEALALTAALSIDPSATVTLGPLEPEREGLPPESQETTRETAPEDAQEPESSAESRSKEPRSSEQELVVSLGPSVSFGRLMTEASHLGAGLTLGLRRTGGRSWMPLEARLSFEYLAEPGAGEDARILSRFYLAKVAYCVLRWGKGATLSLCPVSQVGAVTGVARDFEENTQVTKSFVTVGAEAWLRAQIASRADLWLSPAVLVPVTKRSFAVDPGPEVVSETLDVGWGVSAGVALLF